MPFPTHDSDHSKQIEIHVVIPIPEEPTTLDNGKDCVVIPWHDILYKFLFMGVSEKTAKRMLEVVVRFTEQVKKEKKSGIALGSSDLVEAIKSEFYGERLNPAEYGLTTQLEVKALAEVIGNMLIRQPRPRIRFGESS